MDLSKLNKHPFIQKSLKRMNDINSVEQKYINHFCEIILSNHFELKRTKIAYNNYTSFFPLYETITRLTSIKPITDRFSDMDLAEQEQFLINHNINYVKNEFNHLIIHSNNFETTELLGHESWCIQYNKEDWINYNQNRTHLILSTPSDFYGLSFSDKLFYCFNSRNEAVDISEIYGFIPKEFNLKKTKPTKKSEYNLSIVTLDFLFDFLLIASITETILYINPDALYFESLFIVFFIYVTFNTIVLEMIVFISISPLYFSGNTNYFKSFIHPIKKNTALLFLLTVLQVTPIQSFFDSIGNDNFIKNYAQIHIIKD